MGCHFLLHETNIKVPQFLGLWTSSETHIISSPGSQTFRLRLNYIYDFFNSHICRRQFVGLLGLHSCVSQFLWSISSSVQFSSVAQSCPTLFDPMNCSTPGLPVHLNSRSSLRLTSNESVMPSSHLILCRPLLLLPPASPSIRVFSNESNGCSVQFSHSVVSDSLRPHESQHSRPPCPSPTPRVHSDSRPTSQ